MGNTNSSSNAAKAALGITALVLFGLAGWRAFGGSVSSRIGDSTSQVSGLSGAAGGNNATVPQTVTQSQPPVEPPTTAALAPTPTPSPSQNFAVPPGMQAMMSPNGTLMFVPLGQSAAAAPTPAARPRTVARRRISAGESMTTGSYAAVPIDGDSGGEDPIGGNPYAANHYEPYRAPAHPAPSRNAPSRAFADLSTGRMNTIPLRRVREQQRPVVAYRPAPTAVAPRPAPPPPEPPPVVEVPRTVIDPNGRFATTYRPGGGNLAAFEAALANQQVAPGTRELVADLGARYAPNLELPTRNALAMRAELERSALPPSGGTLRLRIALRSTERPATARPPMSVHLVVDTSGSMQGIFMNDAREAARALVRRLQDNDTFSLTAFSTYAEVLVPAGPVGTRREQISSSISYLRASGGTNISEGLRLAYAEAAAGPQTPETVKIVMLLSDGRATQGIQDRETLARMAASAFQDATQTSSFGIGTDYDGPLMATIADQGAGGYYYLRDTTNIAHALTTELEARAQPVAQALELRVRLRPDVQLTQTYGSRRLTTQEAAAVRQQEVVIDRQVARRDRIQQDRQEDLEGGMRFFIPGFARADRHVILLGLQLPAGVGERDLANIELRYKDRITLTNETQTLPLRIRYADNDAASAGSMNPSVVRTVQGFEAGETLVRAAQLVQEVNGPAAEALLVERAGILRRMATAIGEPHFVEDATRMESFRGLIHNGGPMSEPLLLALLLNTSARGYMH